jgi:serine/threonine protein phosphatase 1
MGLSALRLVDEHLREFSESVLIRGNHDWFPIRILDEVDKERQQLLIQHWIIKLGGGATISSMGYDGDHPSVSDLREVFPPRYLDMLRQAAAFVETEHSIFVHAGIRPGVPLSDQEPYDLMWIREPFLSAGGLLGKRIVHGHTVTASRKPEIFKDRVAIDTGAYETDNLSAVHILPDGGLEFMSSSSDGIQDIEPYVISKFEHADGIGGLVRQTLNAY